MSQRTAAAAAAPPARPKEDIFDEGSFNSQTKEEGKEVRGMIAGLG